MNIYYRSHRLIFVQNYLCVVLTDYGFIGVNICP